MKLTVMRHGSTALNGSTAEDKIRGWADIPLADKGKDEAVILQKIADEVKQANKAEEQLNNNKLYEEKNAKQENNNVSEYQGAERQKLQEENKGVRQTRNNDNILRKDISNSFIDFFAKICYNNIKYYATKR
jgi:bisphosphoglycerate-dependent phosphoglycerate mutase